MNRLESIKDKINHNNETPEWEENFDLTIDAEYLIQRLERYEKALEDIKQRYINTSSSEEAAEKMMFVARDTLDQLKE